MNNAVIFQCGTATLEYEQHVNGAWGCAVKQLAGRCMGFLQHSMPGRLNIFVQTARADLVAGLTVAMVVLPQSMAYAGIAGVNPIYGIFAAIVPPIIGALFGSSNLLVTGPTNATALVTFSVLAGMSGEPAATWKWFLPWRC